MSYSQTTRLFFASTLLTFSMGFSGCSKDKTEKPKSDNVIRVQWEKVSPNEVAQIKVINQFGESIAQAQILIGQTQGNPFRGNFIETDKNGVALIPKEWTKPAHVTVDAAGYIRQTLLNQSPGNMILRMNPTYLAQRAELRGQVTGLPVVNGDKLIDFGLVMPSLSRGDILNFDLDQVISPYTDVLTVVGQKAPLPSNVSLPSQKESYIIGVNVSKPVYRLLVPTLGPKTFYAARGRFPFKTVVDKLRGGTPFYELLNDFTLMGGGLRETQIVGALTTLDIPGTELDFKNTVQVQTATTNPDEVLLMLAASQMAGSLVPTDVKKAASNQTISLTSMADKPVYVVSVIKRQAEFMSRDSGSDRLSAAITAYKMGEKQKLLPLVANPTISVSDFYTIGLPQPPIKEGIRGIAISASISDLIETANGDAKIISANRRWEILGLGWTDQIQLPNWPLTNMSARKKVEINYIGTTSNQPVKLDDSIIDAATHVSHASTQF